MPWAEALISIHKSLFVPTGRIIQWSAWIIRSDSGSSSSRALHEASLQDAGFSMENHPGTSCRALMKGPAGTKDAAANLIFVRFRAEARSYLPLSLCDTQIASNP
jgi:hypothetical protein